MTLYHVTSTAKCDSTSRSRGRHARAGGRIAADRPTFGREHIEDCNGETRRSVDVGPFKRHFEPPPATTDRHADAAAIR